ncbi:uncharacterized protein LOC142635008 [Castanea sativa]|uniref:uncharacterized protein LOC142635008 n=1 Tax=Castanea sativa TaxID=21020 RepID=UPI003F650B9A
MAPKRKSTSTQNLFCSMSSSSSDPPVPPLHVRFHDEKAYQDFSKNFSKRGVHPKRHVILLDFSDTPLPDVIHTRGWESLCKVPLRCPTVFIQKFYSNLHDIDSSVPQFVTTFGGTCIVVTPDLISEILHVPKVSHPDYPSCQRLRTVSKDELLSHFCETPSIWDVYKDTTTCDKLIFSSAITWILRHFSIPIPDSPLYTIMGAISVASVQRSEAQLRPKRPRTETTDPPASTIPSTSAPFSSVGGVTLEAIMAIDWLIQGERNATFFHLSTLIRRSKNRISRVIKEDGTWEENIERVKDIFTNVFDRLYRAEQGLCLKAPSQIPIWGNCLLESEAHNLATDPTDAEILFALKTMKAFKAPGLDGLHAGFFQRFWMVVGESVKFEVKKIFRMKKIPEHLNKTLIALIPKQLGLESINHYRPISLCNTIYKIVTKVLVNRKKHLMPTLVSPSKTVFIFGIQGTNNVIIAQELVYTLERKKGKARFMILKIDLEKTYDRLEWSFVRSMLVSLGFHSDTVDLILSCISSTSAFLLFNGSQIGDIFPSCGLRQGDPISPYIFILCMEFLNTLINMKCEEGSWKKIKASCNGLGFSHMFFADDLLLFAKTDESSIEAIVEVLDKFCQLTGLKISKAKSKILFSPNVATEKRREIVNQTGISETHNLGKYLGFPIIHNGRRRNEFQFVVERVQNKLVGWKSKCLSSARRLVLIKAAVSSIPEYNMQCNKLPTKTCEDVNKLTRDFLWGSTAEKKKLHLVGLNKVANPIDMRGLGIFEMKARNSAILAKLCWRIASSPDLPLAQMLTNKYLTPARLRGETRNQAASCVWKACKEGGIVFNKGLKWSIANGDKVCVWDDFWLPFGPLRNQIKGPLVDRENRLSVKSFLAYMESISFNLPLRIVQEIKGIPVAVDSNQEDILIWAFSKDGSFSLKSAYLIAKGFNTLNLETSPHQWCSYEGSSWFKLNLDPTCELCGGSPESILHTLRDCKVAKSVWKDLGIEEGNLEFFGSNLKVCLKTTVGSLACIHDPVARFTCKLENIPRTVAELWALKDGLTMAKQLGIENICIEMDAEFIVHLVSSSSVANLMLEPLLTDCRNLIKTFPNHTVAHVFREANACADCLARMVAELNHDFDVHILFNAPNVVVDLLAREKAGIIVIDL